MRSPVFWVVLLAAVIRSSGSETTETLNPFVVTATRTPQPLAHTAVAVDVFTEGQLKNLPGQTIDDVLRTDAAFSLFRRSGSLFANPTAQGVSLRGIGPSGASRSLVLLDGVPLNDPFGGWVTWSAVPEGSLSRVEIVRGGGSSAWGNSALGGTVQLFSSPPVAGVSRLDVEAGDYGTRRGNFDVAADRGSGAIEVDGGAFATDGFYVVNSNQRGVVDRPLDSSHEVARMRWQTSVGSTTEANVSATFFNEDRGNGTILQNNHTQSESVAATLSGSPDRNRSWSAVAYVLDERFSSLFSSVNATRTAETPANNQFNVPAVASGGSLQGTWSQGHGTTTLGGDVRWVKGETREDFMFIGNEFTRQRFAGGQQFFAGVFGSRAQVLSPVWNLTAGLRADYWRNFDGHRRETDRATGV
ncbi:MAG: TonB-dependent receptor, partial [Verrucomicrobia bacterium]|nr:TonB-dependent receptor [Verrucomicrobiota bacterium]